MCTFFLVSAQMGDAVQRHGHLSWRPPSNALPPPVIPKAGVGALAAATPKLRAEATAFKQKSKQKSKQKIKSSNGQKKMKRSTSHGTPSHAAEEELQVPKRARHQPTTPSKPSSGSTSHPAHLTGGAPAAHRANSSVVNSAVVNTAAGSEMGSDVGSLLLLSGLPLKMSEAQLRAQVYKALLSVAPFQLQFLTDWSTGKPRGEACVAFCSVVAADKALGLPTLMVGGSTLSLRGPKGGRNAKAGGGSPSSASTEKLEMRRSAEMTRQLEDLRDRMSKVAPLEESRSEHQQGLEHLLLCCERSDANGAFDELLKVGGSGKLKKPLALLTTSLLKRRRARGGSVWRGLVRGLPLPKAEAERLESILEEIDWSAMPGNGKNR